MIRINQIKLSPDVTLDDNSLDKALKKKISSLLRIKDDRQFTYNIVKKSVDSRKKPDIFIVYSVDVKVSGINEERLIKQVNNNNIMLSKKVEYQIPSINRDKNSLLPVIVGFGPAGMFCALMLARSGFKPIVIERGEPVDDRVNSVNGFWNGEKLNGNSNTQFGEGGAGTFSDGKLNTQVKEVYGRISKVLDIFVEHGADSSIKYEAKPHIGTDKLVEIVKSIRNEIISLGGKVMFNTQMVDVIIKDKHVCGLKILKLKENKESILDCDVLVLAIGHSARDTFYMLSDKLVMEQKPFAVGLRIEHKQELINVNEFGDGKYKNYMPASYKLTHKASNGRGVYSFCMCPGGFVVNASSEEGRLVVNGMSYSGRDSENANSAIIVTVDERDFGSDDVLAGIEFQRELENKAYQLANGSIPVQLFGDFENNVQTTKKDMENNYIRPQIKGAYKPCNIREILPEEVSDAIIEGVNSFEKQIKGFSDKYAVLSGIESRTSSPVRILRDDNLESVEVAGLYPCGEGAGYAGGITSAAVDGLKVFEMIVAKGR